MLTENISRRGKYSGKRRLDLPKKNGKKKHIDQIKIQIGKILAAGCPIVEHEKGNKEQDVFQVRKRLLHHAQKLAKESDLTIFFLRFVKLLGVSFDGTSDLRDHLIGMIKDRLFEFVLKIGVLENQRLLRSLFIHGPFDLHGLHFHTPGKELCDLRLGKGIAGRNMIQASFMLLRRQKHINILTSFLVMQQRDLAVFIDQDPAGGKPLVTHGIKRLRQIHPALDPAVDVIQPYHNGIDIGIVLIA